MRPRPPEDVRIPDSTAPLLSTKYAHPPTTPHAVQRVGLFAVLSAARGLVLVSAPPGYGKTTLVTGWLEAGGLAAAWLTLDESDDDPAAFLAYLVAAVRRAVPAIDDSVEAASPTGSMSAAALAPLVNALGDLGTPLVIVLDDFHLVTNPGVADLAASLIRHLPSNVRLVIATRQDPPLPLARLRVRGQLTEIRASDLRFTADDALRFLAETMGLEIPRGTVELLTERTEGWVAGLQLAALSLRTSRDPDAFLEAFGATDRYIFDYLTDEALASQPADVRSFLEATCVLDRLSGPLCDALTGRGDGAAMLAELADANLFLTPLDERRAWYRYHGLFAGLLAAGLAPDRRAELHRAAASWLERNGLPRDGIRHQLAAGAPGEAAASIEREAELMLARGEFRTLLGWCDALSPEVIAAHPMLAVMRAWGLFVTGDIAGAERALEALGTGGALDDRVGGRRACLEAWFANRHDRPEAAVLARKAIEQLPETELLQRSLAYTTLGESLVADDIVAAHAAFESAHQLAQVVGRSVLLAGTVYSLAGADLARGRRREAEALCRASIAELTGSSAVTPSWLGMVHLPLGIALFEADELIAARQHIATGQELCDRAGLRVTMLGAAEWQEILCLHLLGERDRAWRRLEAVTRDAVRHGIRRVAQGMILLAAELLLLEGDAAAARRRLDELPSPEPLVFGSTRDRYRLTRARALLAAGRPAEALATAEPLADNQRAGSRLGRLPGTLVVIAAASDRAGDPGRASRALEEAVAIAAAPGYRRAFVDTVVPLNGLLPRVRHVAPAFVDSLAAGDARQRRLTPAGARPAVDVAAARPAVEDDDAGSPVEPLSVRELEVLRLVAAGLSNEEIGRQLFVSGGTAKWHVHNVLAKVGARNRVGLVARSRSLGLL